jgi:glycosyltransferase involved in cell wall biosynthesis
MPSRPERIALLVGGGPAWIAGFVYTQNVAAALSRVTPRPEVQLVVPPRGPDEALVRREIGGFEVHRASTPGPWLRRIAARAWNAAQGRRCERLESLVMTHGIDAVFPATASLGSSFPARWTGWIPDLQHVRLPSQFSPEERSDRDRVMQRLLDEAPRVVVSSEDARKDVLGHFRCDAARVTSLPFHTAPVDSWFDDDPSAQRTRFRIPDRYLMFPSQFWTHKNHRTLFEALHIVRSRGVRDVVLVCTGTQHDHRHPAHFEELMASARSWGIEDSLILPGLLPRHEQVQLMRGAAAIVQPSLFEGWSALLEDVRLLGKTAYASDIAVHREQNVPGVTYFEPENAESLAALIVRDWSSLPPGPDLEAEREARARGETLSADFGRRVLAQLGSW